MEALPYDYPSFTDQYIVAGSYKVYNFTLAIDDVLSGYMETDETTMGLDFFICNDANLAIWLVGGSASGYEVNTNMHTLGWEFTAPSSGGWHIVLSNAYTTNVYVDIGVDINGDNTPFYSASEYDYTGYGDLLEVGEYHEFSVYLYEGTVVDGHFATFFPTDGIDFFICDDSNFDDWESGFSATLYDQEYDMHQAFVDTFTIPTSGTWHFVWENNDIDAITISYGISLDTSGAITDGGATSMIGLVGIVAGLLILIICCCVSRSKKKQPVYVPPSQPTGDHYTAPQPTHQPTIKEREIVRDRVLVICPYCGAKNEQGVLSCYNCDAEL